MVTAVQPPFMAACGLISKEIFQQMRCSQGDWQGGWGRTLCPWMGKCEGGAAVGGATNGWAYPYIETFKGDIRRVGVAVN